MSARVFTKEAFHFRQHKAMPTGKLWVNTILGAYDLLCVRFGCLSGRGAYNCWGLWGRWRGWRCLRGSGPDSDECRFASKFCLVLGFKLLDKTFSVLD